MPSPEPLTPPTPSRPSSSRRDRIVEILNVPRRAWDETRDRRGSRSGQMFWSILVFVAFAAAALAHTFGARGAPQMEWMAAQASSDETVAERSPSSLQVHGPVSKELRSRN